MTSLIYVIGNGPSLRGFDFHAISGADTLGMNLAFRHWHRINWYPTYYACLDTVMIKEHGQAIRDLVIKHGRHFRGYFLRQNILEDFPELESFPQVQFLEDYRSEPLFNGLWEHITTGSFSVLYAAMLGYRQIRLLGIDLNQVQFIPESRPVQGYVLEIYKTPTHNPNYFIDDYQRVGERFNIPDSKPNLHQNSWKAVSERLTEFSVKVINCSQDSKLELFLRETIQEATDFHIKIKQSENKHHSLCITFIGINSSTGFSGGRYHAWMMAEAAAEQGFEVHYVTDHLPSFLSDFDDDVLFPRHRSIHLHRVDINAADCRIPRIASDVVVVVPHQHCQGPFADNAIRLAAQSNARLVLINFETPNWFNQLSPVKRDESAWTGWLNLAKLSSMIISLAEESSRYAAEYYCTPPGFVGYKTCWAPINTRVADSVKVVTKQRRILVFARFAHAEHKGFNHLYDLLIPEMCDYTLVLIVGVGKPNSAEFSKFEEKARRLGIVIEVQYCVAEREKWRELKRASLLIFLSYFEGFGLPPVEARYAGIPCVCFELPVLREVSGAELYYAPLGDLAALADHIRTILTTRSFVPAGQGPAVVSFDEFGKRVANLLREAVDAPRIDLHGELQCIKGNSSEVKVLLDKDGKPLPTLVGMSEASIDAEGLLVVRGWCLAPRPIDRIRIFFNGKEVGLAILGKARADIHMKHPEYANAKAGFSFSGVIDKHQLATANSCKIDCYVGEEIVKTSMSHLTLLRAIAKQESPIISTLSNGFVKADWGVWTEFNLNRNALERSGNVILICAHFQPTPVTQGNRVVLAQGVRVLRDEGYKVVLVLQLPVAGVESMLSELSPMVDGICAVEPRITADTLKHRKSRIDYYHPHTEQCVQHLVSTFGVKAVIAHYVHMAFVLRNIPSSLKKLVITHDVLHRLGSLGVNIDAARMCSADEEAELLKQANVIVAINEYEHRLLERMLPGRNVITVGIAKLDLPFCEAVPPDSHRVLYTASGNLLNAKGLEWFLREVWPLVLERIPEAILAVAGQVCNTVPDELKKQPRVELMGVVDDLECEFERAAVVVNCTRIGTGLKIKSIEALCRGKALVSTSNGVEGIPYSGSAPFVVADDAVVFAQSISRLLSHSEERKALESQARCYALAELNSKVVYAPLLDVLSNDEPVKTYPVINTVSSKSSLPRIVLLTPHAPIPANRGNRQRVNSLWRGLSKHAALSVGVFDDRATYLTRDILRQHCVKFFPRRRSLDRQLKGDPDAIARLRPGLWETSHLAELLGDQPELWKALDSSDAFTRHVLNERRINRIQAWLRSISPHVVVIEDTSLARLIPAVKALGIRVIADMQNIDSKLYADIASRSGNTHYGRWLSTFGAAYADSERQYLPLADEVWTCSDDDRGWAIRELQLKNVRTMPNVVPVGHPLPTSTEPNLVYIGQLSYKPNEDAALYLIELSKRLTRRNVRHHLHLVGNANERIRQAASYESETITVHGVISDLRPILSSAAVVPVPLRTGGGTRIKILEAMAAARAVVSTSIGIEGIIHHNGKHCIVTDDDARFEDEVVRLLNDAEARSTLGRNAYEWVRSRYSLDYMSNQIADSLHGLLTKVSQLTRVQLTPETSEVWFNPRTRLLRARLNYPLHCGILEGRIFTRENFEKLHNATVNILTEKKLQAVELTAVIAQSLRPEDIYLALVTLKGMICYDDFSNYKIEHGGLLSFELNDDRLRALAWTEEVAQSPSLQIKKASFDPVSKHVLPNSGIQLHEFLGGLSGEPLEERDKIQLTKGAEGALATFYVPRGFVEAQSKVGKDLTKFKDIHAGKRAWLIGNGPSVRTSDLDMLTDEITFCFNRFYLAHPTTRLRATYTVSGDRQMIEDFGEEIAIRSGGQIFFANDVPPKVKATHIWLPQIQCFPPLFSFSPDKFVSPGGSSLYIAMQLAHYMGIQELLIYGADFNFVWKRSNVHEDKYRTAMGDRNHFISNYRNGLAWCPPSYKDILSAFISALYIFESDGRRILNVSRASELDVFVKSNFDDFIF